MRPRGWLSWWVKVRPWYYSERSSLASRSRADAVAIEEDFAAARPCEEGDEMCVEPWPCVIHDRQPHNSGGGV